MPYIGCCAQRSTSVHERLREGGDVAVQRLRLEMRTARAPRSIDASILRTDSLSRGASRARSVDLSVIVWQLLWYGEGSSGHPSVKVKTQKA